MSARTIEPSAERATDVERAARRLARPHARLALGCKRAADVVLFTTGSNGRAAVEMFNRFGQEGSLREIPTVLLLDQNHTSWAQHAQTNEHRVVAKMPIKMRDLRGALVEASKKKVS